MKLFLIRHAETEHNVAGLLAGVTDSALTNHGLLQTQRLGKYLVDRQKFTHIFSSDLQRAYMTAKAIEDAQSSKYPDRGNVSVVQLVDLREQDFGSFECLPWSSKKSLSNTDKCPKPDDAGFKPKETGEAMANRANVFLNDYLLSQLAIDEEQEAVVAVISHGLLLAVLWKSIIARFGAHSVSLGPEINGKTGSRPLEYLPGWSNTGYIELEITPISPPEQVSTYAAEDCSMNAGNNKSGKLDDWNLLVRTVNSKQHLSNLKRTRGGLGSSVYDARQKNLEGYFKKPKATRDD